MEKIEALAKFLDVQQDSVCTIDDIIEQIDDNTFNYEGEEYLVLTDEEADQRAADYIRETLWAFNANFLVDYIDAANHASNSFIDMIKSVQDKCEGCNDMLLGLVGNNIDALIEGAISADGRGHFMSSYDGEEHEEGEYFIYRTA